MRKFLFLFVFFFFFFFFFSFDVMATKVVDDNALFSKFIKNLDGEKKEASFVQTKTFVKYNKSFVVTGKVKFVKDVGLLWMQDHPKDFRFIATKRTYCMGDGQVKEISVLPYMNKIKEIVDDVVGGNFSRMDDVFFVDYSEDKKGYVWNLVLVPKISKLSSVIKKISLSGDTEKLLDFSIEYLNGVLISVVFEELNGEIFDEIKC